jgi:hypothetical protein
LVNHRDLPFGKDWRGLRRGTIQVAMSGERHGEKGRAPRSTLRAALLCACAAIALLPAAARAQDAGSLLRGEVSEEDVNDALLATRPLAEQKTALGDQKVKAPPQEPNGIPAPAFQPASQGATPDEQTESGSVTRRSIFTDDAGDAPPAIGRPRTAQQREQERKKALEPAQSASTRLARARQERDQAEEQDTTTTGTVRAGTIDSENELRLEPDSEREDAIEGLDKEAEENPYAPVGMRLGTFTVYPSLESGVTWTSNADSSFNGEPATLSETTLRLNAISEWGGDRTSIESFANYRKTISGEEIDETRGGIRSDLERELGGEWKALASLGYEFGPESASSPTAVEGTLEQPIKHTFDGSLGVEKDVGKVQLRLTGNVEREMFGDAELSTGGSVSQADQNNTLGTVVLRTGYEVSPALTPFVELEYGQREYDEELDSNGFARSSTRWGARGGLEIDLGEKFKGEMSAGWIDEDLDDERLESISGPTFAASLDWSPERGTIVGLDAETIVEGSTTAGESGSLLHSATISVSREVRANLTADLAFGGELRDYTGSDGQDKIWNAEAGLTWWLNRYVGLTGKYSHEQLTSNLPDRDYDTDSVFVGLKLQR